MFADGAVGLGRKTGIIRERIRSERDACDEAQKGFGEEIARLKRILRASEMRLRELQRGERIAAATDRTQRLRDNAPNSSLSSLRDAEATLSRLRTRQKQIDAASTALDEMERSSDPGAIAEKLAAAGCGAPTRSTADQVLARLAIRVGKPA